MKTRSIPRQTQRLGNSAGANDEIFGFHPGGVTALLGDGSVRFLKESLNIVVQRSLITPQQRRGGLVGRLLIRS